MPLSICPRRTQTAPSLAGDVKMVIGLLQLPVMAIIAAISVKDSAAMKSEMFPLHEKYKEEGLVRPIRSSY
jgi:hypothetical protein